MLLPLTELAEIAREKLREAGAEKVNIIAWSRAGLAARMLACEMPHKIASVSTVCTAHYGLRTVEKRLGRPAVKCWSRLVSGKSTDFGSAVLELAAENMREFNKAFPNADGVFYQSAACAMKSASDDRRLSAANNVISIFDGENDGVVSVYSALWGQRGKVFRGVSHLNAGEEIYADLLNALTERGL